uniref:BED-type domain-containing protein n=1 Tax=Cannabis sativa TaxID=3483 RepID=A0A803QYU5_CANSA
MAPVRSTGLVDPGWEHGIAQDEKKKKVKCNYCGKVVSGGIYRLKQHLARVSGEVTYCNKAPEEVYLRMKENLEGCRSNKKPPKHSRDNGQGYLNFHSNDDEELEVQVEYRSKGKQLMNDRNLAITCTPLRSLGYVDPGWEHCVAQDERKKKVKCNYCEKIVSGGINRFKQHLARIPGEVAPCKHAPDDVYIKMKDNMKWHRTGRKQRRADVKEISSFYAESDSDDEEDESEEVDLHHRSKEKLIDNDGKVGKDRRKSIKDMSLTSGSEPILKRSRLDSVFMNTFMDQTPECYRQVKVKTASNKQSRKEVLSAICRFFYHAGVPLQASDSVYFYKMLELVGQHGQGLVGPSSQLTSSRFLQEEVANQKNYLIEYKASWAITGCSILADSWRDTQGRTLINFLSSGPNGVYFVSSIDATEVMEDSFSLFKLLDKVVEEIGEENVVQVVTRNTPAYKNAGKMLEEKRNNLFWTPCATDCIDQMLEDFLKIKCVGECMEKGQQITKFIYSQIWLINLMKIEFTQGKELLRSAGTRCASSFATLQSLLDHRTELKRMFQSSKWVSSGYSKASDGKEVEKIVLNTGFWKKVHFVVKSVDPIMQVLQTVESGDSFSMPSIYYEMYRAKLAIKSFHGDDGSKYGPFLAVVENHWNSLFYHRLYMAAYFLNPAYRYQPDFVAHAEVVRGLNDCITRLEPDNAKRVTASMQLRRAATDSCTYSKPDLLIFWV